MVIMNLKHFMKHISYMLCVITAVFLCSCDRIVSIDSDFNITLDKDNVYVAGEPVRFNIHGNIDNLVFYDGVSETGIVVKNIQDYLYFYEYVWNEPGTYKVVFEGVNYAGGEELDTKHEFTIIIRR